MRWRNRQGSRYWPDPRLTAKLLPRAV